MELSCVSRNDARKVRWVEKKRRFPCLSIHDTTRREAAVITIVLVISTTHKQHINNIYYLFKYYTIPYNVRYNVK